MRPLLVWLILLAAMPAGRAAVLAPGQMLDGEALVSMVVAELSPQIDEGRLEVTIEQPALPLPGRATQPTTLRLERLTWERRGGRFEAVLVAELPTGERGDIAVRGRAALMLEVAVPTRALARGSVVEVDDLELRWLRATLVPEDALRETAAVAGGETRRPLARGRAIRGADLARARLVRRGDVVEVIYRGDGIELDAVGEVLEDAAAGQVVRVVNVDSRAMRRAVVIGPKRVEVLAQESVR